MLITFADVVIDLDAMQVERAGRPVPVEPQVFDVLAHLVRNRDRLVPRVELLDEVWGDRFVSDSALSSRIKSARRAIGDNGRDQRLIRTVHGRGFRFVGEVRQVDEVAGAPPGASAGAGPAVGVPSGAGFVDRVRAGRGGGLEVVGGSAATRADALDEAAEAARAAGLLVGRGEAGSEHRPYGPVLDAFDEWLQRDPTVLDELPLPCRAELEARLAGGDGNGRQRLFVAAQELLVAAGRRGAVLLVDDLHLVDRSSQELLRHLARAARRHPVAVVVSHRADWDLGGDLDTLRLPDPAPTETDPVPTSLLGQLQRAAVLGPRCHEDEVRAALGPDAPVDQLREAARAAGLVEVDGATWSWTSHEGLAAAVGDADRAALARSVADHLDATGGDRRRLAQLRRAAGDEAAASAIELDEATRAAFAQEHLAVLELTAHAEAAPDPTVRSGLLGLRADARAATGEADAVRWYREALRTAPADEVPWLRVRLARASLFAGDIAGAAEALEGVEPSGSPYDGGILLVSGMVAYFQDDLERAQALVDAARPMALAPGAPAAMLDVIALDGMIAHSRGEWFDRLRRELRASQHSPDATGAVFDSHICVSQYLLYGPTGHDEVREMATGLRATAEASGSRRAAAFATTLLGEAELLSGRLDEARRHLADSVEMHRDLGADTGLAHALQRLAEVELAGGDRVAAERLCRQAMPLARFSPLSRHHLQRIYGTLIAAAPDAAAAVAVVDEAEAALDDPTSCEFCQVMVAVPAAKACALAGRRDQAEAHLRRAAECAARWEGPAWPAAVAEAEAVVALVDGRHDDARSHLEAAVRGFELADQVLDAARCREALDDLD